MKHNNRIVIGFFKSHGIPEPEFELVFADGLARKWRFDLSWTAHKVALEIQGGVFVAGRHSRGAAMLKEWEKLNAAACLGWRILYCQPKDLLTAETAGLIKHALAL